MDKTWTYDQRTGVIRSPEGKAIGAGYSGAGDAKNDPTREAERAVGPIPRGRWRIGSPYNSANVGPFALPLEPVGHDAHGRTAFRIHGDSIKAPGTASHGCIILARGIRNTIAASPIKDLVVT